MDYPVSAWTSHRVPSRTPSNQRSTDAQQSSEPILNAISDILASSSYRSNHNPRYRHPPLNLQRIGFAEPDANSENFSESSSNINSAAPAWSSYHTPRYPSKWPSNWPLVNTRPNGALQITVTPAQPKCTACWTELDETTTPMPCGHYWCSSCIVRRFTKIRNQSEWPVRCHHTRCIISLDTARPFLQDEDIQRLISLIEEFETAVMDRVYCSNAAPSYHARIPKTASCTVKHAKPKPAQIAKELLTKVMTAPFQIKPSKKSSSDHTKRSGRDAHDAVKCAKESAVAQELNVYVDTISATTVPGQSTLAMAAPSVNMAPD